MTGSQQETLYRSDVADREEEISRLKADLNILHEKLAQSEGQVGELCLMTLKKIKFDLVLNLYFIYRCL